MAEPITSAQNERIKRARRVRDGQEDGQLFIEGVRLAEEAVYAGLQIKSAFIPQMLEAEDASREERLAKLVRELESRSVPIFSISASLMKSLSDTLHSQGIICLAERPSEAGAKASNPTMSGLFLALDRLQDPGNVGTLLRTAEAAGVQEVLAVRGCADVFSPKVLRSAMGSAFRLPIHTGVQASEVLERAQQAGWTCVVAAGEGACDYTDYDWTQPTLLFLGNEGAGVSPEIKKHCQVHLKIPMQGQVESLNVAAAGAVMLFEAARQCRGHRGVIHE